MDLNLTDEEKTALDKERETEEKKSRDNFLRAEMKLLELDAKIKGCLCLEKADTEQCLKLLDELAALKVRPLMLLKHPACLETVKRMRAYVGNTPSWDLTKDDSVSFTKQAHKIRKQADVLYSKLKELFTAPQGVSFWEYFSSQVLKFKQATSSLSAAELLEMMHEPIEMTQPSSHDMKSAIDAANAEEPLTAEEITDAAPVIKDTDAKKKDKTSKKETPKKTAKKDVNKKDQAKEGPKKSNAKEDTNKDADKEANGNEAEDEPKDDEAKKDAVSKKKPAPKAKKPSTPVKPALKRQSSRKQNNGASESEPEKTEADTTAESVEESTEPSAEPAKEPEPLEAAAEPKDAVTNGDGKGENKNENKTGDDVEEKRTEAEKPEEKKKGKDDKEKEAEDEPRAKRSRLDNKKSEAPPRSPARTRKTKA